MWIVKCVIIGIGRILNLVFFLESGRATEVGPYTMSK
jgi:hypothetical protein